MWYHQSVSQFPELMDGWQRLCKKKEIEGEYETGD